MLCPGRPISYSRIHERVNAFDCLYIVLKALLAGHMKKRVSEHAHGPKHVRECSTLPVWRYENPEDMTKTTDASQQGLATGVWSH